MKLIHVLIPVAILFISVPAVAQTLKKETIRVSGNCTSCKKHIEKAAMLGGVTAAQWNTETKLLTISYNPGKVSSEAIQKSIAAAGYDTEKFRGDDKAYKKLDECCQYDRKDATPKKP